MGLKRFKLDESFTERLEDLPRVEEAVDSKSPAKVWIRNYCRHQLILSDRVCSMNLSQERRESDWRGREKTKEHRWKLSSQLLHLGNWVLALYALSMICISSSLYLQYRYDRYRFHLVRLRGSNESLAGSIYGPDLDGLERRLRDKLGEFLDDSRIFGTALLHGAFSSEYFLALSMSSSFLCYFLAILFGPYLRRSADCHFVRAFLFYEAEQRELKRLIVREANQFLASNFHYAEAILLRFLALTGRSRLEPDDLAAMAAGCEEFSALRLHLSDYWLASRSVRRMIIDGRLRLINRSAHFYRSVLRGYFWYNVALSMFSLMIYATAIVYLTLNGAHLRLQDIIFLAQFSFLSFITSISGLYLASIQLINWIDQSRLIGALERLIKRCLRDSMVLVELSNEDGSHCAFGGQSQRLRAQMNEQLLEVLLNYRIFLAQLRPVQVILDYVALVAGAIMFAPSILARLHSPYVGQSLRMVMVACATCCTLMTVSQIVLTCSFHERCLRINRLLSSLMAWSTHLARLDWQGTGRGHSFYNQHTLWVFRQELNHPELIRRRLVPSFFGFAFTYSNLTRALFWLGLIVLSVAVDSPPGASNTLLGGLLNDPLRVFELNMDSM